MAPPRLVERPRLAAKPVPATRRLRLAKLVQSAAFPSRPSPTPRTKKAAVLKRSGRGRKSDTPKRPRSAYAFYVHCFFKEYRLKHPDKKINLIEVSKKCAAKWHSLTGRTKEKFYDMAAEDKSRYLARYDALMGSSGNPTGGQVIRIDEVPRDVEDDLVALPGCSSHRDQRLNVCHWCLREMSEDCSTDSPRSINSTFMTHHEAGDVAVTRSQYPIPTACFYPARLQTPLKNPSVPSGRPSRMVEEREKKIAVRSLRRVAGAVAAPHRLDRMTQCVPRLPAPPPHRLDRMTQRVPRLPTPPPQCGGNEVVDFDNDDDDDYEDLEEEEEEEEEEEMDLEEELNLDDHPRSPRRLIMHGSRDYAGELQHQYRSPSRGLTTGIQRPCRLKTGRMGGGKDEEEGEYNDEISEDANEDSGNDQGRRPQRLCNTWTKYHRGDSTNIERADERSGCRRVRQEYGASSLAQKRKHAERAEVTTHSKRLRQDQPEYYT